MQDISFSLKIYSNYLIYILINMTSGKAHELEQASTMPCSFIHRIWSAVLALRYVQVRLGGSRIGVASPVGIWWISNFVRPMSVSDLLNVS